MRTMIRGVALLLVAVGALMVAGCDDDTTPSPVQDMAMAATRDMATPRDMTAHD